MQCSIQCFYYFYIKQQKQCCPSVTSFCKQNHHPARFPHCHQTGTFNYFTTLFNFQTLVRVFRLCSLICKTLFSLAYSENRQFHLDWLWCSFRNFEWAYSVDFYRVEGYQPGKLCFWIFCFASKKIQRLPQISACFCYTFFRTSGPGHCGKQAYSCIMTWLSSNRFHTCNTTFLTSQLLFQIFIYFGHTVLFKGNLKRPGGVRCWRSCSFWIWNSKRWRRQLWST